MRDISVQHSLVKSKFFETIKIVDGQIFSLEYHQRRYESVLKSFGLTAFEDLRAYICAPSKGFFRCKLVYDADSIEVAYYPYEKRAIQRLKLVVDDAIVYSFKSTDRTQLDALFAKRSECDDVLIVRNGLVSDTSIANIAFESEGIWYTPKKPLLEGTTRARLLDEGKLFARDIAVEDLKNYSGIALMNAMIEFDIITQENAGEIIC
ncbi:MAG: aminotransferase class IV family protein [Sulfurimonas sp.]|nr:aminotransferase class IV family protein [Sulfurimonas sp.]